MIDLILMSIFCYALYRMAESYNITPWKWIWRYVLAFVASAFAIVAVIFGIYGEQAMKDAGIVENISLRIEPFILLYQFVLFFFFRLRIIRYVQVLDQADKDKNNNNFPHTPSGKNEESKEQKDFSYFR
jgi:CBS domain containing-hemolysin-like protein